MEKNVFYYVWVDYVNTFIEVTETGFKEFILSLGDSEVSKKDVEYSSRLSQVKYYINGKFLAVVNYEVKR